MKKLFSVLVAFTLLVVMALPYKVEAKQVFSDVPVTHSNYEDIMYLLEKGVIEESSKYGVGDIVTREEVAVMVAKAIGLDGTTSTDTKFSDVKKSNKNSGYIQAAVNAGIVNGYGDNTFKPNQKVTRGHMAAFIARAFELPAGNKIFKDVPTNHTAYEAVKKLAAANITTGYNDGTFKPENSLTRAHISAFLARAMKFADGEPTPVPSRPVVSNKEMKVHFLDVDQGDSIFIQAPNGKTMLIDGGTKAAGEKVVAYLQSLKINKIDYVVATHPDADHIGGLIDIVNTFEVGEFIDSGKVHTTATYEQLLTAVDSKGVKYTEPKPGDLIALDSLLKTQVLHVDAIASDNNEASIVLKMTYNKIPFLFMGDAGIDLESDIAAKYGVAATILKAGHHGSSTSSSLEFLQKVKPAATILSYGKDNDYGHPHDEVIANLKTVGSKVYSTAEAGMIVVTTDGNKYSIIAKEFSLERVKPVTPQPNPEQKPAPKPTENTDVNSGTYVIPDAPTTFKNCDAMREYYPSGVSSSHPAYAPARDGDKDGWACEPPK